MPTTALREIEIAGTVSRLIFRNPNTDFHVLAVRVADTGHEISATCSGLGLWPGRNVKLTGRWASDSHHGHFFKAATAISDEPTTADGLRAYLCSGAFKGIGKSTATRLVAAFGTDLPHVIDTHPEKLEQLPGIGRKAVKTLADTWRKNVPGSHTAFRRDAEIFLRGLGMTSAQIRALHRAHGRDGASAVRRDPYLLTETVRGIGFARADAIATHLGLRPDDFVRTRAGINEAIRLAAKDQGHCLLPERELIKRATNLLRSDETTVRSALRDSSDLGLAAVQYGADLAWTLPRIAAAERIIARTMLSATSRPTPWSIPDPIAALRAAEAATGKTLTAGQRTAFLGILRHGSAVVTGGPGTGKTTLLNALMHALKPAKVRPLLTAPTGRAAVAMTTATNLPADTIHMLLGSGRNDGAFRHNQSDPLDCDLIVVDEMSMVDTPLAAALFDAVPPRAALLLIGDPDQLEPIGPGNPLADIIASGVLPTFRLTEVRRQAGHSSIITVCQSINAGIMPNLTTDPAGSDFLFFRARDESSIAKTVTDLAASRLPALLGLDPTRQIQLLSPMKPRLLGTFALGTLLSARLNPNRTHAVTCGPHSFAVGDKVIHIRNNYDIDVRNGEIGIVTKTDPDRGSLRVAYDRRFVDYADEALEDLQPGWCITVHKIQGSECPVVVMPIASSHSFMLRRRLVYTAASRPRIKLAMVGHPEVLARAIADARTEARFTQLPQLLRAA